MPLIGRIPGAFGSFAVVLVIAALSNGAALAGDATGAAPKNSAPIRLDPKASELSPSALGMEDEKGNRYKLGEEKTQQPDLKIPDHIEFGETVLHFDTSRKNPIPRVGVEANDQPVINKAPEESPLKPDYFGLRFTAPIH